MLNKDVIAAAKRVGATVKSAAYVGDPGAVGILNVGDGDLRLSFDKSNPAERIRAARVVRDMLRRGFALLVEVDVDGEKKFARATDFDEEHCVYIVADFDSAVAAQQDRLEESNGQQSQAPASAEEGAGAPAAEGGAAPAQSAAPSQRAKRGATKRIPAEGARAVAVGRTAGG